MAWLQGWDYCKEITINNNGIELIDYQLKFNIYRSTSTSTGFDVYIDEKCETDYDDIRFTTGDGTTLCDYWIEDSTTDSATIWVEFNSIAASGNTTAYLYYGNSEATGISSATNTFIQYHGSSTTSFHDSNISATVNIAFRAKVKGVEGVNTLWGFGDTYNNFGNSALLQRNNNPYRYGYLSNGTDCTFISEGGGFATEIIDIHLASASCHYYVGGNEIASGITNMSYAPIGSMGLMMWCAYGTGSTQTWSLLRNYTIDEPTIAAWGPEIFPVSSTIIGKYDVRLEDSIIGKYNVDLGTTLNSLYNVSLAESVIGKYSILPQHGDSSFRGTWSKYIIEIFDPILTEGQFNNLKVRKRISQIPIATFDVVNPSAAIIAQLIYNAPIRIRINGRLLFTGVLKRIEKDDNVPIYHLFCEGGASILRDINIPTTTTYSHYGSYYIINDLLQPATNWENFTTNWSYIDYTVTPGNALNHIVNICKMEGFDWEVRQANRTVTITDISGSDITVDGDALETGYYDGRYGALINGSAANSGFTIVSQTGNVLTVDEVPDGAAVGDSVILWGKYYFMADKLSTTSATVEHWVINKNACKLNRKTDADKVVTSVIGVGQNPETSRMVSWATACTFNYATLAISESCLTVSASDGAEWFYIYNTSDYANNGTVMIGDEKITYTNKSGTGIGPCTRGYDSTAAYHYVNDDVLMVNELTFTSIPTTFPDAGSFWLGTELIDYTAKDSTKFYNLTRGASSTHKYRHGQNTVAFDFTYTDTSPEALSPAGLYGLQKKTISVIGATIRDTIDRRVQQELLSNDDLTEYGDFTLLSSDYWHEVNIGDRFKFTDKSGTDNYWTIIGSDHEQYKPLRIYFGRPDEGILEDFARIDIVNDSAREKGELAQTATILEMSADYKQAKVQYTDGSQGWVELV